MKPRRHRNNRARLTNAERAATVIELFFPGDDGVGLDAIKRAIQAACRATLARSRARKFRPWTPKQLERAVAAMPVRVERRRAGR